MATCDGDRQMEEDHDEGIMNVESEDEGDRMVSDSDHGPSDQREDDSRIGEEAQLQEMTREHDANGLKTRLIIEKLEMSNFKSYAGTRVVGPFHKRFTSIVGPNGSGKSNVIDAMLFVFGKRASTIRMKKVSELVHNSENHKGLDIASVSVHFVEIIDNEDDDDDYEAVEGSRLVVCRTADKRNNSKYYLNDCASSFTHVQKLLREKGIDLDHNRFLILQGEVEQISLMKPKAQTEHETGILEYLEEIIGTNRYVEPLDAICKEVEMLNEDRTSKLQRLKVVQKERDAIEDSKDEAVQYLRLDCQRKAATTQLYQKNILHLTEALKNITDNDAELRKKREYEQEKMKTTELNQKELEKKYDVIKNDHDVLVKELAKCVEEFNVFQRKDVEMQEQMKHVVAKRKKLKSKLKREGAKLKQAHEAVDMCQKQRPDLEKRKSEVASLKIEAEARKNELFDRVRGKTEGLRLELEGKQKELIPLRHHVNERQQRLNTLESELSLYTDKVSSASAQFEEVEQSIGDLDSQLKSQTESSEKFRTILGQREARLKEATEELKSTTLQLAETNQKLHKTRSDAEEVRVNLSKAKDRGSVLSCLAQARQAGSIPGFYGRLGDLGSIDSVYDVAISTACPQLNNMVVDCVETAQMCTTLMRKKNAGRATFIILDKLRIDRNNMDRAVNAPENVPRLFDLVRIEDARFRPAFYFAMSNTLVAENLDQAVRIGNSGKRHRVVSLNGDLIDSSGTMSGGGNRVARGGMSSVAAADTSATDADLQKLSESVSQLTTSARTLQDRQRALEAETAVLSKDIQNVRLDLSKAEMHCKGMVKLRATQQSRLQGLQGQLKLSDAEQREEKRLKAAILEAKARLDEANADAKTLEDEVSRLEQAILKAGGAQLKQQVAEVERLSCELDELGKAIIKSEVDLETAQKSIGRLETTIEETHTAIKDTDSDLAKSKEEQDELSELAASVEATKDKASELAGVKKGELDAIVAEVDEIRQNVHEMRSAVVEIDQGLQENQRQRSATLGRLKSFGEKLKALVKELSGKKQYIVQCREDGEEEECTDAPPWEFPLLEEEQVAALLVKDIEETILKLDEEMNELKPNMSAIEDYKRKMLECKEKQTELEDVTRVRDAKSQEYDDLRLERRTKFEEGFRTITMKLKEMYQMLTLGGDAELEMVDSLDPFREGITFSVRPPKKSWKNISNLSGGEKTLSSLALVFALHYYKPTPLYVMDEIDAALDFKNVSIVANYIKERTRNAQFVIISLRNNMFEIADRLVGIYKTDNASKSITINPSRFSLLEGGC